MADRTILVVEDDAPVRGLFARALTREGYRVYEARNGREAIAALERHGDEIDLLVTDMRMPLVDGAQLVEQVRQRQSALKVLGVSGYPPLEDFRCDSFLQKPFTNADFLARVRELVAAD
jgi:CheY-like chemotaxis protein